MANVRGINLISTLKYVREKKGESGVKELLASLDEETRKVISNLIPKNWYPYETDIKLDDALEKLMGESDPEFFKSVGKYVAEDNLKWYLKLFLTFAPPQKIINKFPTLWELYFDTGEFKIVKSEEKSAIVRIVDFDLKRSTCLAICGWGELALEKAGAKNMRVSHPKCRAKGDDYCEFRLEWE